ncbi:MAG: hypothetical protein CME16_02810 [Gemmatimonadetes bacterium]|nr:hypothetical protein [Gemmatimonadota bacterium]
MPGGVKYIRQPGIFLFSPRPDTRISRCRLSIAPIVFSGFTSPRQTYLSGFNWPPFRGQPALEEFGRGETNK